MSIHLTVLGVGSANPLNGMYQSASFLRFNDQPFILDCGDGSQFRFVDGKVPVFKAEHIFITHLHGDHFLGLPGLLNTFSLNNRKRPLTIFGPTGLRKILDLHFEVTGFEPTYKLEVLELEDEKPQNVLETEHLMVTAVPLDHRVKCFGYIFQAKASRRNIDIKACESHQIPKEWYSKLQRGEDYVADGEVVENSKLTFERHGLSKFSYITDTRYLPSIIPYIKDSDLLFHEATFLHELAEKAQLTGHSTAIQAAKIAKEANVKQLIISHFSSRYFNGEKHQEEAQTVFDNTLAAYPGIAVDV